MNKKTTKTRQTSTVEAVLKEGLDFSISQKQVADLMATVCYETSLNENKICFIKEQLAEQSYVVNAQRIASNMLAFSNIPLPELEPED